jgi:membrane-associated protein
MTDQLLEFLLTYGAAALVPILFASAIGVPLPGTLLLVAAGAFAGGGQLPLVPLLLGSIVATLGGNAVGYWIGLRGGQAALARWGRRFHIGEKTLARADAFFGRYGGLSVLFSRFPLSPLSAIINILAGVSHYPIRSFILANLLGVTVWAGVYVGLGYAFESSWEALAEILNGVTQALTLLVVVIILLVLIIRAIRQRHDHDEDAVDSAASPPDELPIPAEVPAGLPRKSINSD